MEYAILGRRDERSININIIECKLISPPFKIILYISININIIECKCGFENSLYLYNISININIIECK